MATTLLTKDTPSVSGLGDTLSHVLRYGKYIWNVGDGTTVKAFAVPAGTTIIDIQSYVTTAMDGTSSGILFGVGDGGGSDGFMDTADVAPYTVGAEGKASLSGNTYAKGKKYTSDDSIDLFVTENSSTTGRIEFFAFYLPSELRP